MSGLGDRTSPDISAERPVVLIPLGSTEQHGPHLPVDTDTRIAVALCERAAASLSSAAWRPGPSSESASTGSASTGSASTGSASTGSVSSGYGSSGSASDDPPGASPPGSSSSRSPGAGRDGPVRVRVAPAVAYGASGEHQGFAGTLSIGQDALERVVVELARSAGDDYPLVVFVNGHGGNAEALARARATLEHERRQVRVWSPRLRDGDSHAGRTETSVLLALAPEMVRLDRAEPGVTTPLPELLEDLRSGGLASVTPNGVLGDPTGASADEGRTVLDSWATDLLATITAALT